MQCFHGFGQLAYGKYFSQVSSLARVESAVTRTPMAANADGRFVSTRVGAGLNDAPHFIFFCGFCRAPMYDPVACFCLQPRQRQMVHLETG